MIKIRLLLFLSVGCLVLMQSAGAPGVNADTVYEKQLTFSAVTHLLDNNDNFSRDDQFLCYDTRDTKGTGIGNGTSIEKVNVLTGKEIILYAPKEVQTGTSAAPGMGAASFSPIADEVAFIHGPFLSETPTLGFYGTRNRRGAVVAGDGSGKLFFMDRRDITSDVTIPGAHRGGSHRHEYTLDGKRVGFTYDDHLLQNYPRTCGFMVPHAKAPSGATHYAVLLVPVVPAGTSKPGELEEASGDSWIGAKGLMRGFIGKVKQQDGTIMSSLFVVDVPENVDVTTADSGTKTRFPSAPKGVTVRRLTNTPASGIVRGSQDGQWIGYYAASADKTNQVFIIHSQGSDKHSSKDMQPIQVSKLEKGASGGLRWHPSGNSIAVFSDNGVAVICVKPGALFGTAYWLTPHGSTLAAPEGLVWSRNGKTLAYNRRVPTYDAKGNLVKDAGNNNFRQIFLTYFPDDNNNGIADPIEKAEPNRISETSLILQKIPLRTNVTADIHALVFENTDKQCNAGSGSTVLAIPGSWHSATTWRPFAQALLAEYDKPVWNGVPIASAVCRVVALDMPGHNRSSLPSSQILFGELQIDDYVAAIQGSLDRLRAIHIRPNTIVANSSGGLLVQRLQHLLLRQETSLFKSYRIRKAVLLASAPPQGLPSMFFDSPLILGLLQGYTFNQASVGKYVYLPEPDWVSLLFTAPGGLLAANAPSPDEVSRFGYNGAEPLTASLELALPTMRPQVNSGVFQPANKTLLQLVSYENDLELLPHEAQALFNYLSFGANPERLVLVKGPESVHDMYISEPVKLLDALEGKISFGMTEREMQEPEID